MASPISGSTTPDSIGSGAEDGVAFPSSDSTTSSSEYAVKKSRRQTAFYPHVNSSNKTQKPFSRSAAKRESVMALGSIEHLQYYFTKTGIKAKKNPLEKNHHGLVPAIGGENVHNRTNPSITSISDLPLPPTPVVPDPPTTSFAPHIKSTDIDPETLLPGVIEDLSSVSHAWLIDQDLSSSSNTEHHFDVLDVLQTTTHAIRSTRNYVLSLPDESAGTIREHFRSNRLGPAASSSSSGRAAVSSQQPDPLTLIRRSALEVLTSLREIEEKTRLPLSDDAYDAQSDGGTSRGAGGSGSSGIEGDGDEHEHELTGLHEVDKDIPVAFSLVQVQGRYESVPVWEDPDAEGFHVDEDEGKEKKDRWDERLVLGGGWLYRQDITLESLSKERKVVADYLDVVDEVLFEGKKGAQGGQRGWEKQKTKLMNKARGSSRRRVSAGDVESRGFTFLLSPGDTASGKRRVSTGMLPDLMGGLNISEEPAQMEGIAEEETEAEEQMEDVPDSALEDDELPEWARRLAFMDSDLERAHALLSFLLPPDLHSALSPDASSRSALLESLSSGQLLCVAYNAGVRKSKKPWGYVNKYAIHDILALEQAEAAAAANEGVELRKKGWTFRRTDNLRLWVGALKIRYMLPIIVPTQVLSMGAGSGHGTPGSSNTPLGSPIPLSQKFPTTEPSVEFDAKIVARKDKGWEDMLEAVLMRWMWKVVDERRTDR